ncbi:DNA breaking-rejoining enzyme [Lentinula raphanica]|nr:DNA breaking-rejoining enzyme [Lentinula raphanica]
MHSYVSYHFQNSTLIEHGFRCDELNLDSTVKDSNIERATFTHAQKMRAAATFGFGRIHGLGMQVWHRSEITGKWMGNPSVSETLSCYMLSLRRRKTLKGEVATSARAITSSVIRQMYDFNNQPELRQPRNYGPTSRNNPDSKATDWGGPCARALLNLGYAIAFCGLLRVDELLKIQLHDIGFDRIGDEYRLVLNLPLRKTSQFGDIKPFVFWKMPEEYIHLCVVDAYARWIVISGLTSGFLFRKIRANDRIADENEPMTSEKFLEMFRNNLVDIKLDHFPYGTHSFRRGGCQWLSVVRRWPLRQICEWGGWSKEFTHLTIVKYLISWNDNPTVDRDDFFNMNRAPTVACPTCNRTCHCA